MSAYGAWSEPKVATAETQEIADKVSIIYSSDTVLYSICIYHLHARIVGKGSSFAKTRTRDIH